jgi:hypothetical protein
MPRAGRQLHAASVAFAGVSLICWR